MKTADSHYSPNVAMVIGAPDASSEKDIAAYIAAANPATMLQLIAIIRENLAADGDEPEEENGK